MRRLSHWGFEFYIVHPRTIRQKPWLNRVKPSDGYNAWADEKWRMLSNLIFVYRHIENNTASGVLHAKVSIKR